MAITYPGTLDTFVNPTGTSTLDSPDHALQHSNVNDAIEAVQAVVGTTAGTAVLMDFSAGEFAVREIGGTIQNSLANGTSTAFSFGTITVDQEFNGSAIDTTTTLGTSDTLISSQKAVKTYIDDNVVADSYIFQETDRILGGTIPTSAQGVAYDGTNVYLTDNTSIYKYDYSAGTLITSRDISGDGTMDHIGDIAYYDGSLYVFASNYPTTPIDTYVMQYNTSLAYQSETQLTDTTEAAGITYADGSFWVSEDDNQKITQYTTVFVKVADFTATQPTLSGTHKWNGIEKIDNMFYLNPHGETYPYAVQQYYFNGVSLKFIRNILRPPECTQSIAWDSTNNKMLFALRHSSVESEDGIITAELLPRDYRNLKPGYSYSSGAVTTTSTAYVENATVVVSVNVKRGDIVKVDLLGNFKVSTSGVRAYIDSAAASATTMTLVNGAPSCRTDFTGSDGVTLSTFRIFRADGDGIATFAMFWRINSAGTATCSDGTMMSKVIGHEMA